MAVTAIDGSLRDVPGLTVGHWTNATARTGCTLLVFDQPALTAAEVRGAAPGTRDIEALAHGRVAQHANAILLTGGSAFGLAAADGVMRGLAERGIGFATGGGPVPIVPAAVIFDLANGDPVSPTANDGRAALDATVPLQHVGQGAIGAGTGATWDKFHGTPRPGGLGIAQIALGEHLVTAFVVLNAMGAVHGLANDPRSSLLDTPGVPPSPREASTLMCVVTSFPCDHGALVRMCVAAHDALARLVIPAHTMFDGDIAFATTLTDGPPSRETSLRLSLATELAVEAALMRAAHPVPPVGATLES